MIIYMASVNAARESYWQQQSAQLKSSGATMSSYLNTLNNYTHQLSTHSTLLRFTSMDGKELNADFVLTAWDVMQILSNRAYGLFRLPVQESHIFLSNSNYIISSSQFTESEQYYRAYRGFAKGKYDQFVELLLSAGQQGIWRNMSEFTGNANSLFYICSMETPMRSSLPAVIWFEVDVGALRDLFLPDSLRDEGTVLLLDKQGEPVLLLGKQDEALAEAMRAARFDAKGMARHGDWQLLYQTDSAGRRYIAAYPQRLCDEAVASHSTLMLVLFFSVLVLGVITVYFLVQRTLHPYQQLHREMDAQRPLLSAAYVRKLLSGHVSSQDELDYITDYLGLTADGNQYFVLYCIAHQQSPSADSLLTLRDRIAERIDARLSTQYPVYYYTTLDQNYVVLVSYDASQREPLIDLQQRVVKLHDELADDYGLWFYAGAGDRCTQASRLWESYEQARTAARYTTRHHIFLPYEFIHKDKDSWYYPIELSAKFLHFITSGNRQQVSAFLELIHKENVEERNLPVSLLNFLLSDLQNTLLKARFQIAPPKTEEESERLRQLDERLMDSPTFSTVEANALALCDFFVIFNTPSDPIADVERYLKSNYSDPSLCLTKLSEMFSISESYLSHLFKARTGTNLSVYLEQLRMEEAARRLRGGMGDLSTLYADLGYASAATFRRAFKKYHGVPPSQMREET